MHIFKGILKLMLVWFFILAFWACLAQSIISLQTTGAFYLSVSFSMALSLTVPVCFKKEAE